MKQLALKYRYRLQIYLFVLLALAALFFVLFLTRQSKGYSVSSLQSELKAAIGTVEEQLKMADNQSNLENIILPDKINFTLADTLGNVYYDSKQKEISVPDNILSFAEVVNASQAGEGSAMRTSIGEEDEENLYYAKKTDNGFIRTYVKFRTAKPAQLEKDNVYLFMISILLVALIGSFIYISGRLSKPVKTYSQLVSAIRDDESKLSNIEFGHDEFGNVGREIADTFQQLERAKKYKQQMSHNIAHELKTPLTGIKAYLETIMQSEDMPEDQIRKFVGKAYTQTLRLTDLVSEVSTLNKLDESSELKKGDESVYQIEEVNIKKLLQEIIGEIGYKLEKNNVKFSPRISSQLKINGSYTLIYSLFKNLIDNSIEHGGKDIEITLVAGIDQVSGEGGYKINFTYTDTGQGVPPEALERIFERFYRVEEGRTRKTGGSGLGLAIVKNAVAFHKGTIKASLRPGGGIIFKFSLSSLPKES